MDDLINRQAAIEACLRYNGVGWVWSQILDEIKEIPSAGVRCKDCKYFDSGTDEDGKLVFKCLGGWAYGGTSEDDFCSHGERNDE